MQRAKGGGAGLATECYFRFSVRKNILFILVFFFKCWHGLTGSVQSVSDFRNRNQTEPELFCDFLIG
jgi:hypothetical protein